MGAGASSALAELAARSPGVRIGGVSLKAKTRRAAAPVTSGPEVGPESAVASVLGTSAGPEGAVPGIGPIGLGDFPPDFVVPELPTTVVAPPGADFPPFDFGTPIIPGIGGGPIFAGGGGGGGGTGGGGTGGGGGGTIIPPPPPPVPGVPEPSVWLMLIAGFGTIGAAMRRERRVRIA